jgi:hypothetical protein
VRVCWSVLGETAVSIVVIIPMVSISQERSLFGTPGHIEKGVGMFELWNVEFRLNCPDFNYNISERQQRCLEKLMLIRGVHKIGSRILVLVLCRTPPTQKPRYTYPAPPQPCQWIQKPASAPCSVKIREEYWVRSKHQRRIDKNQHPSRCGLKPSRD